MYVDRPDADFFEFPEIIIAVLILCLSVNLIIFRVCAAEVDYQWIQQSISGANRNILRLDKFPILTYHVLQCKKIYPISVYQG